MCAMEKAKFDRSCDRATRFQQTMWWIQPFPFYVLVTIISLYVVRICVSQSIQVGVWWNIGLCGFIVDSR